MLKVWAVRAMLFACFSFTSAAALRLPSAHPLRAPAPRAALSSPAVLTREDGKNGKLAQLLSASGVPHEELPCIAFERLDGCSALEAALRTGDFSWCIITSPESATVFLDSWQRCGTPSLRIASVGAGTAKVLEDAGIAPAFVPSKATAKVLAAELPLDEGVAQKVIYPASAIASSTIEEGLSDRGATIERINTYTTVPANWSSTDETRAREARVVTFASPSAVRVWAERAGTNAIAVCIGETSAAEARRVGFTEVRCPESPGVKSWANEVVDLWTNSG